LRNSNTGKFVENDNNSKYKDKSERTNERNNERNNEMKIEQNYEDNKNYNDYDSNDEVEIVKLVIITLLN